MSKLLKYAADPAAFRADLRIKSGRGAQRYGDVLADFQRRDFEQIDLALLALRAGTKPKPARLWLERTKGCSKDTDLAAAILWLLATTTRSLTIQVGAADQEQADELRKAARDIVNLNGWLAQFGIDVQATRILGRAESVCDILTADAKGSHGARPDLVIINELTHHGSDEFASTLLDNAAKVPHGVVVVATNAGDADSWQWRWREDSRTDPRWYFSVYDQPAPWLDADTLAELERKHPPGRFARLWRGVWAHGTQSAIEPENLAHSVRDALSHADPRGKRYFAGLDLGHTRDAAALVIISRHVGFEDRRRVREPVELAGPMGALVRQGLIDYQPLPEFEYSWTEGDGRLRVEEIHIWRPTPGLPVSLNAVQQRVIEAHQRLGLAHLYGDPWQFVQMAENLLNAGVPCEKADFVPANLQAMAQVVNNAFRAERNIEIATSSEGAEALIADLRELQCAETSYGFRLTSPRHNKREGGTRHGDTATALQLALLSAARSVAHAPRTVSGDLVLWPSVAN